MASERARWDLVMPVVVAVFVGMWLVGGWVLLTDYQPTMSGDGSFETDRPASAAWFRILAGALSGTGIVIAVQARGRPRALAAAIVGTISSGIAALVSTQVMFDQIALKAVTVGWDIGGLWWPVANSDEVRFLLIDGHEVGVATYQRRLIASIIAVVVASVALLASVWPSPPDRDPRRESESIATRP